MKKLLVMIFTLILLTGCGKKDDMKEIKKGTFNECSEYTIEELINNYMESPKWEKVKSDKGYYVYNVTGKALYNNKNSEVLIQFALDNENIIIKTFEVNKIRENNLVYSELIKDMCEYTKEKKKDENATAVIDEDVWLKYTEDRIKNIDDNKVIFSLKSDKKSAYGNSIIAGSMVDVYSNKIGLSQKLLENVQIIAIKEITGELKRVSNSDEFYLLFEIPKDMEEIFKNSEIVLAPSNTKID